MVDGPIEKKKKSRDYVIDSGPRFFCCAREPRRAIIRANEHVIAFSDSAPDIINVFGFGFFNWYLEARVGDHIGFTVLVSCGVSVNSARLLRRLTQLKQYVVDNRANTKTVTYTQ